MKVDDLNELTHVTSEDLRFVTGGSKIPINFILQTTIGSQPPLPHSFNSNVGNKNVPSSSYTFN